MLMALGCGAILPTQAAINFRLSKNVGGPVLAAFVSFAVGTIALLLYLGISGQLNPRTLFGQPSPWWMWIGGLLGIFYVVGIVMLVPRLGVALAFSLVVAGQAIMAVVFDHFGWLGVNIQHITAGKIIGTLLLIAGVILIRKF